MSQSRSSPPRARWLEFADGRRVLDFHGQYMCVGVGHGDARLRAALHAAIDQVDYVCEAFTHEAKARAAKLLVQDTMAGSDWAGAAKFASSGSEAVECALLMARLYMDRPLIVTREGAYHGWTGRRGVGDEHRAHAQPADRPGQRRGAQ